MKRIHAVIKGIAPLLQHRFPVEEHGENASKQKQKMYKPEDEAKKALYQNDQGIFQPAEHIYQALVKASVQFKFEGKKTYKDIIKAGLTIEPECIPMVSTKPYIIDARPVVIQRARVICWRPRFDEWKLEFDILIIDEGNLNPVVVREILDRAGFEGIGSYRPRFGRFQVIEWKEV